MTSTYLTAPHFLYLEPLKNGPRCELQELFATFGAKITPQTPQNRPKMGCVWSCGRVVSLGSYKVLDSSCPPYTSLTLYKHLEGGGRASQKKHICPPPKNALCLLGRSSYTFNILSICQRLHGNMALHISAWFRSNLRFRVAAAIMPLANA